MVLPSRRGTVPVFIRPTAKPAAANQRARLVEGTSPRRPAGKFFRPTWMRPLRKVPVATTTARTRKTSSSEVRMPVTRPSATRISSTTAWRMARFGWFSSTRFMRSR